MGASGKAYNKICPGNLEAGFLNEFNRGRKRYLTVVVSENDKQIRQLEREISKIKGDLGYKRAELTRYQYANKDEKTAQIANELSYQVSSMERTISAKQSRINQLNNKNREIRLEIIQSER